MSSPNYNFKVREWYWQAVERGGEAHVTSPYYDASTGLLVTTIAKAMYD